MLSSRINFFIDDNAYVQYMRNASDADKEITQLLHKLSLARARRNAFTSIYRLPDEILALIFGYCLPREQQEARAYGRFLGFTAVSRRWNDVSKTPIIWTVIILGEHQALKGPFLRELLRRSKDAPLSITIGPKHIDVQDVICALEHLRRTWNLTLILPHSQVDTVSKYLVRAAPILQRLTLENMGDSPWSLPDQLLRSNTPLLEVLHLNGCKLNFSILSPSFVGRLRSLEVMFHDVRELGVMDAVRSALGGMPMLQNLSIDMPCLIIGGPTIFVPERRHIAKLSMPHLRSLHLCAKAVDCEFMLQTIVFPPDVLLKVECHAPQAYFADLLAPLACHSAFQSDSRREDRITTLRVETPSYRRLSQQHVAGAVKVEAWVGEMPYEKQVSERPRIYLDLSWSTDNVRANMTSVLAAIYGSVNLSQARTLELRDMADFSAQPWHHLAAMSCLQTMITGGMKTRGYHHLLQALTPTNRKKSRSAKNPHTQLLWPRLRTLRLQDLDFGMRNETGQKLASQLGSSLARRAKDTKQTITVEILRCLGMKHGELNQLRTAIGAGSVKWDGIVPKNRANDDLLWLDPRVFYDEYVNSLPDYEREWLENYSD